jgi:hypothetical protein
MKKYLQDISPQARSAWRRWQVWWIFFYAVVMIALGCIAGLLPAPGDIEVAQSYPPLKRIASAVDSRPRVGGWRDQCADSFSAASVAS